MRGTMTAGHWYSGLKEDNKESRKLWWWHICETMKTAEDILGNECNVNIYAGLHK